jgi:hypothetical protein
VLSIPTPTSAAAAKASSFSAPGTTGTTPATAKVAFVALPATASATAETSFAAATAASGSTSSIGFYLGLGFIDGNSSALQLLAVQTINGCLSGFFGGHFHKAKTLGFATEFIHDYTD